MDSQSLDLNLDFNQIKDHNGYKDMWKTLGGVEIRMVEKYEECKHCPDPKGTVWEMKKIKD